MNVKKPLWLKILNRAVCIAITGALIIALINIYVISFSKSRILTMDQAAELQDIDCILVLGCGIIDNRPGLMLKDRLDKGIELYNQNSAPKLLMSGDHGQNGHDEVSVMKRYAINKGVSSSDIFMDHAGFSTYESMYRAKEIFRAQKVIIVTQRYHMHRAIYIAQALGLEAYGVAAEDITYYGQTLRDIREILARTKDFFTSAIKPEPTFLGNPISLEGDGNITND